MQRLSFKVGGDKMQEAGVEIKKHIRELAFMGFVEVLMHIGTILKNFRICKKQIKAFDPDVIICVDYPGFNLRMATGARNMDIKLPITSPLRCGHGKKTGLKPCVALLTA